MKPSWSNALSAAFALQGMLILALGVAADRLRPAPRAHAAGLVGAAIFAATLALYPLMAVAFGRDIGAAELFAIAPDPTAAELVATRDTVPIDTPAAVATSLIVGRLSILSAAE